MAELRCRVLVADEGLLSRWALSRSFRARRFRVWTAGNAVELLRQLLHHEFDVVIGATSLDGEDITGLLAKISAACPELGLIVLCGPDERDAVERAMAGAEIVEKPFSLTELGQVVGRLAACERHRHGKPAEEHKLDPPN